MSFTVDVRRTDQLTPAELAELRAMLVECFGPRYDERSWQHCLGGLHYLLRYEDRLVSHGALVPRRFRQGGQDLDGVYGESMATLPALRHRGLGSVVVSMATAEIRLHHTIGVFAAGKYEFYERLGWRKWRGPTYVETAQGPRPAAPARGAVMFRLPQHSTIDPDADLTTDWRDGDIW
ncbi:GNAT family N-acetyltransferase [Streptomyces sp. VRA16 Mangrove soil]|uniref:GNAT family N-acetyltransferase n=1 Tax=Streptomyces sp. VRA16 Mangrove soil TaxID=2817434 RepID=UPI001A9D17DC|nr:GNAT family N-acetyltransferase [Streptomyces sp. VRA16 Mangrove soil]MBO1330799.1 GNAT family N-acetyltransferase [Streptomyces sp. VRA16 Mangrove soil]